MDLAVDPTVEATLRAVREVLGMEVAYVSEIVGGDMVLRQLVGDGESFGLTSELSLPLEQTYCQRMLDGRLPNLIPNVRADDRAASLPVTRAGNIGAFATVPVTFADGRVYGTLCAASHEAQALGHRDLQFLKVLARLLGDQVERKGAAAELGQLAALVNAADDAILATTPACVITNWNRASERMFGYSEAEAIGRDVVELVAPPGAEAGMRQALASVAAGQHVRLDARRRRADGVLIDTSVALAPIRGEDGQVHFISAVVRDISAAVRRESYRAIEGEVISALECANDAAEAGLGTLRTVGEGFDCDFGVLWEVDEASARLRCRALWISGQSIAAPFAHRMRECSFARGEESPGNIWASEQSIWIESLSDAPDSPLTATAVAAGLGSAVGMPLRSAGEVMGVVEFFTARQTRRNAELLAMGEAVVARLADALSRLHAQQEVRDAREALEIRVRKRTSELERVLVKLDAAQIETVRRLSRAVEFRDEDTGAHIARISTLSARIARRAGLDIGRCRLIERASPLHDVGKVAVPDSVLLKPGPLTAAERRVIQTHAEIGHDLLAGSESEVLQLAAIIALTHHERWDGDGYPRGLAGESIPIEGRIVAIADVFDALTSDRVYRPAMAADQALAILRDGRGTHFDPCLLAHFLADIEGTAPALAAEIS